MPEVPNYKFSVEPRRILVRDEGKDSPKERLKHHQSGSGKFLRMMRCRRVKVQNSVREVSKFMNKHW